MRAAVLPLLLPLLLACASLRADAWEPSLAEQPLEGVEGVTETRFATARPPGGAFDRIELHRYRSSGPSRAALLYLPGTYMNGEAALRDERHSLWLYLARRGVEVWALDYRTHSVPPEPGEHDFMADWTLQRFASDAREALGQVVRASGHPRVFVAGFSRGATFAYAVACTDDRVAGLVVLDGPFKRARAEEFDGAAARASLLAKRSADDVAHGIGWETRAQLMEAASADPGGPALASGFDNVGDQLARLLYDAWQPGALADAVNGVSQPQVLGRLLAGYDRYWPAVQNVEGRSIASQDDDPTTPLDDAWGEMTVPVLYFGATNLGSDWILDGVHSAVRSGSPDVELHVLEGWGHLDVLVGERAREEVFEPVRKWIVDRSPPPEG